VVEVVEGNRVVRRIVVDLLGMVVVIMVDSLVAAFLADNFVFAELR